MTFGSPAWKGSHCQILTDTLTYLPAQNSVPSDHYCGFREQYKEMSFMSLLQMNEIRFTYFTIFLGYLTHRAEQISIYGGILFLNTWIKSRKDGSLKCHHNPSRSYTILRQKASCNIQFPNIFVIKLTPEQTFVLIYDVVQTKELNRIKCYLVQNQ